MRMAFGLTGLLVTVAILVYVWSSYTEQTARSGLIARGAAEQIAGVESGDLTGHVSEHIKLSEFAGPDGKLKAVLVNQIDSGSSMQAYYGLRPGDQIIEVGVMRVRDMDGGLAVAMVQEAYQRKQPLAVVRDGRRLDLPQARTAPAPLAPPVANPQPAAPAPTPGPVATPAPAPAPAPAAPAQKVEPKSNPLHRQLDAIKNYGQ